MKRLEELFAEMTREIPFVVNEQLKPYILELAQIYAREVAQASLDKAVPKWNSVKDKMPLAYKTGDWDGKKSDPILVMGEDDKYRVATYYEGYMDGTHFQEFYDDGEYLINKEVTHWLEISDFHTITNNITLL
ncbi:hypothetical protein HZP84_16205 [Elizabethkingia anophelis]|nr:hypothetical protein [Elizabethkingia anophelis]MCT3824944.1 hypothetical protein [Elizabethkingia anophelis]MCT3932249.1 hypothetical protein [Elizabethkingia anophelis]MCT4078502.1 hypothetical protein [Elizabethkingia anophelis]MCT4081670.1 hypothetical protein [Elizabethkingia anophelis]